MSEKKYLYTSAFVFNYSKLTQNTVRR